MIEDPDLRPDESWGEDALGPPDACRVIGYFPCTIHLKAKLEVLEKRLQDLEKDTGIDCRVDYARIDQEDWAESWKAFFWPERITQHITVKPTWRSYEPQPGETVVEIDPGMAFGTGTHPTTAMCIRLIEQYVRKGDAFLDVGVGSGILMAVAAKLGAGFLCGIDSDDIAAGIAEKNLVVNRVSRQQFVLKTGNLLEGVSERFELIVANILSREILALLEDVPMRLSDDGVFICSGIIEKNSERILSKIKTQQLNILEILKDTGWVAIACRR